MEEVEGDLSLQEINYNYAIWAERPHEEKKQKHSALQTWSCASCAFVSWWRNVPENRRRRNRNVVILMRAQVDEV